MLYNGDCLRYLKEIPDKSVDFVLCDPPYGTTACKWDFSLPMRIVWAELIRVTKPKSAIALFGSEPFSSRLRLSFIKGYKYDWIWHKTRGGGFVTAKYQPMQFHENISIFSGYKGRLNYYPIFQDYSESTKKRFKDGEKIFTDVSCKRKNQTQGIAGVPSSYYIERGKFPESVQKFKSIANNKRFHPTQKPVPLLEYLIKTYTLEGQTVLDFTMGSGSTGVAAANTNREFIGIELEKEYFEIAKKRIEECHQK